MVEIFSTDRTMSLGCFVNFKAAKGTLSGLADAGILSEKPAVMVCSYKNDEPQQEYVATYSGGKWHTPRIPKVPHAIESRTKRRHRKRLRKEYPTPEHCFREGFPDWMNGAYPVPYADNLRSCNRKCRIHAV